LCESRSYQQNWAYVAVLPRDPFPGRAWIAGAVVDAARRRLTDMKITASDKMLEVDFRGGVPVAVSGQNGGVYPRARARRGRAGQPRFCCTERALLSGISG